MYETEMSNLPGIKPKNIGFCPVYRQETEYTLQKEPTKVLIKGKEYTFNLTVAKCKFCGSYMDIHNPDLLDINSKEIEERYRKEELKTYGKKKRLIWKYLNSY